MKPATYVLVLLGAVANLTAVFWAERPAASHHWSALLGLAVWNLAPYVALAALSSRARSVAAQRAGLMTALLVSAGTLVLLYAALVADPGFGNALVLTALPAYQLALTGVVIGIVSWRARSGRPAPGS